MTEHNPPRTTSAPARPQPAPRPQLKPAVPPDTPHAVARSRSAAGTRPMSSQPVNTQAANARSRTPSPSAASTAATDNPAAIADDLIVFTDVHLAYPGAAQEALAGISCRIGAGEHVCVLGANGSGKSTFAQLISALMLPSSGTVQVAGTNTAAPDAAVRVRRQVASVFQHPEDQLVTSVVADDVAFGPENTRVPQPQIVQRVDETLAQVGMGAFAQRDPEELSGGQQQRVAIAGALAMHPRILVLDEPSAMLDTEGRRAIGRIVAHLVHTGITVIHVTHFMDDALAASRVLVLERGHLAFDGTAVDLFGSQRSRVEPLGLEAPFALRLHDGLGAHGIDLPLTAHTDVLLDALASSLPHGTGNDHSANAAPVPLGSTTARAQEPGSTLQGPAYAENTLTKAPLPTNMTSGADVSTLPARHCSPHGNPTPSLPGEAPAVPGRTASREAPEHQDTALVFEHVSFSYNRTAPRRRWLPVRSTRRNEQLACALDDLSFTVATGTITALVGHTGSGKSTTVELACALKRPLAGRVLVNGIDTAERDRHVELRRCIGYVSQLPERQLFAETVFEDVAFGPRNLGLSEDEVRERVHKALATCGLEPSSTLLARSPFALSGGQQRAVAIAGVLAMRQPILVLDEPMAGLDPVGRTRMRALLAHLRGSGTTILLVTHDMDDVAELADRMLVLADGHLIAQGTPRDVFRAAAGAAIAPNLGAPSAGAATESDLGTSPAPAAAPPASGASPTSPAPAATSAGPLPPARSTAPCARNATPSGMAALGLPAALAAVQGLQRRGVVLTGTPLTLHDLVQEVVAYAGTR